MRTSHGRSQEEYVLDLDIPDWCSISQPPMPEADKTPKSPPTIPATYKIPQKRTCASPFAPEPSTKKGQNLFSLLHGLTPEPYKFLP
uniref:Uncharacterized protein n=1 Tax=Romanomermis culicivorax TaxID=13658 RepID=A0A915JIZ5_ROMCU